MNFFKQKKKENTKKSTDNQNDKKEFFRDDLLYNVNRLKLIFKASKNTSLKMRDFEIPYIDRKVTIMFLEGTVDNQIITTHVIEPILEKGKPPLSPDQNVVEELIHNVLTTSTAGKLITVEDTVQHLVNGNTIIFVQNEDQVISVETTGFENRAPSEPTSEPVVKGPKVAFNESSATNRSLIRGHIKNPNLICELIPVGKRSPQQVSVMYLDGIVDEELLIEIKKRLAKIDFDAVLEVTMLEQFIEERPYSLIPSTMTTERPDRTAFFLQEGHIALLLDGSPLALIVPITFWSLFQTVEDQYFRWAFGNTIRLIRLISIFLVLFTPAIYVAVTTFHPEMIPTDLLLAIAATRERVPVPAILELLFMQIAFEILRESSIRIPTQIGPTIGIVGALILGQSAVDANLVSPILVVVVAITGLASFTIPDMSLNVATRIISFIFIMVANFLGFLGIAVGMVFMVGYLVSVKSFGVPFFAPFSPNLPSSKDLLLRPPIWKQWIRPLSVSQQDRVRSEKPKGDAES